MGSRVKVSYKGVGDLLRSAEMEAEMRRRAENVKQICEATAPVDESGPHPGRYAGAFRVESERTGGVRRDRAVGRVVNDAPESFAVEFGNRNTPQHRTMGKALIEGAR